MLLLDIKRSFLAKSNRFGIEIGYFCRKIRRFGLICLSLWRRPCPVVLRSMLEGLVNIVVGQIMSYIRDVNL